MKILFDKESNTITIIDNIKRRNILLGITMIFNILFIGWNILKYNSEELNFPLWLWIILLLFIVFGVIKRSLFIIYKTTSQSKINASEIEFIKFFKLFNRSSFYISLRNGKRREVGVSLKPNEYATMVERCNSIGIEIRPKQNI
ncbi:MAG: hypothetical protein ACD_77C00144G0004 [uncultured bacterium]|nr:MAG: hypothetical protein ACD_77C00144G0004 [uncultured bacterium]